jgi:demethylmenaquinone methyltransferase/2-methoxy-6-polyprenyl-1,4-benzoquinol methylase
MFGSIAKRYDRTNAILSFQLHRFWNSQLIKEVTDAHNPESLLDICCGTGEIAFAYLKKSKQNKKIFMLDFCEEMLECAKVKGQNSSFKTHNISYIQGDAQQIPLEAKSVQSVTVAYGIRNVQDPSKCIREVFRVLKPGGTFGILELTEPTHPVLKVGHQIYLKAILPVIGRLFTSNKQAYEYLCNSIQSFVKPHELETILKDSGFVKTSQKPLAGGIATIIYGKKPLL